MTKPLKLVLLILLIACSSNVFAGNKDRQGEAGASELLINPWARSSGWDGLNTACIRGIEALNLNVAGLGFTRKTELVFSHTNWLGGTGISFNTFGLAQSLGKSGGVLGISIMSIDFGDIPITTMHHRKVALEHSVRNFLMVHWHIPKFFLTAFTAALHCANL